MKFWTNMMYGVGLSNFIFTKQSVCFWKWLHFFCFPSLPVELWKFALQTTMTYKPSLDDGPQNLQGGAMNHPQSTLAKLDPLSCRIQLGLGTIMATWTSYLWWTPSPLVTTPRQSHTYSTRDSTKADSHKLNADSTLARTYIPIPKVNIPLKIARDNLAIVLPQI